MDMEKFISTSLRVGVMISGFVIAVGLAFFFMSGQSGYAGNAFPVGFLEMWNGLLALKPFAVIDFGLVLLIFTPVFRVVVALIASIKEKDTAYVWITGYVLLALILSLLLGKAE